MLDGGRQLPAVAGGRANLHGGILVQQVTSLSPGRSHAVLQDAQQGDRPLGTASLRSQSIRPPRDLYEEAGRPGLRRKTVRIQSRQQGLEDLHPSQGHGRGKPQRDLFGDAGIQSAPGRHARRLPLRGRRPPIHVSTGRTFNGGGYLRRRRLLLSHGARGKDATPATGGTETQQDERHLPRASHITSTPLCLSWGRIGQLWGHVTKHRTRHNGRT